MPVEGRRWDSGSDAAPRATAGDIYFLSPRTSSRLLQEDKGIFLVLVSPGANSETQTLWEAKTGNAEKSREERQGREGNQRFPQLLGVSLSTKLPLRVLKFSSAGEIWEPG